MTRTGREGARFAARLDALGFKALHLPLVRLAGAADPDAVRDQFAALTSIDGLVLTSAAGVRQSAALGLLETLSAVPTIVPGPGTARLAKQLGLQRVSHPLPGEGSSEAMLALQKCRHVEGQRWLILAADDGRRLLDETLRARGATVHRLIVYRREAVAPTDAELEQLRAHPDWVTLLASGSALDRLVNALPADIWRSIRAGEMIVPSARLHDLALARGVSRLRLAQGAGDDAMLEALMLGPSRR